MEIEVDDLIVSMQKFDNDNNDGILGNIKDFAKYKQQEEIFVSYNFSNKDKNEFRKHLSCTLINQNTPINLFQNEVDRNNPVNLGIVINEDNVDLKFFSKKNIGSSGYIKNIETKKNCKKYMKLDNNQETKDYESKDNLINKLSKMKKKIDDPNYKYSGKNSDLNKNGKYLQLNEILVTQKQNTTENWVKGLVLDEDCYLIGTFNSAVLDKSVNYIEKILKENNLKLYSYTMHSKNGSKRITEIPQNEISSYLQLLKDPKNRYKNLQDKKLKIIEEQKTPNINRLDTSQHDTPEGEQVIYELGDPDSKKDQDFYKKHLFLVEEKESQNINNQINDFTFNRSDTLSTIQEEEEGKSFLPSFNNLTIKNKNSKEKDVFKRLYKPQGLGYISGLRYRPLKETQTLMKYKKKNNKKTKSQNLQNKKLLLSNENKEFSFC